MDHRWRTVFISSELARLNGVEPSQVGRFYGESMVVRHLDHPLIWGTDEETALQWWHLNVPIMRRYLEPGDPDFEAVFSRNAEPAGRVQPAASAPRAWQMDVTFPPGHGFRSSVLSDLTFLELRLNDDEGRFLGVARLVRTTLPEGLLTRLGRGDRGLFERMDRVSEPARRPAAILFADLEASGELSRRLPSRAYFDLISGLTDLIDSAVIGGSGIVGKHAGDGGSALFLTADFGGSESAAARAAIEAARAIRAGAAGLGPADVPVRVNIGVHWGATLMVGQVATRGRLEVTALGDQMNEAARIEAAATGGAILASKDVIERLDAGDAAAAGIDPGAVSYTPLAQIDGASDKAIRDAGAIAVAEL
jgi:class 3 adenylate cyclase